MKPETMELDKASQRHLLYAVGALCFEGIQFHDYVRVSAAFTFLVDGDNEYHYSLTENIKRRDFHLYKKVAGNKTTQTDGGDEEVTRNLEDTPGLVNQSEVAVEQEVENVDSALTGNNFEDVVSVMPQSPLQIQPRRRSKKKKNKEIYSSPICQDTFEDNTDVEGHLNTVHDNGSRYDCPLCNSACVSLVELNNHTCMKQEHENGTKQHTSKRKIRTRKSASKQVENRTEKLKSRQKGVSTKIKTNKRTVRKAVSNTEGKRKGGKRVRKIVIKESDDADDNIDEFIGERKSDIKISEIIADECFVPESESSTQVKCAKCGKEYKSKRALRRHFSVIHDAREYQCELCGKNFTGKESLNIHKRGVHMDLKLYKCPEPGCEASFNFGHSLRLHKLKHSGSRPHQCSQCGKTYLTAYHLKVHIQATHSERKQFSCTVCGKQFSYSTSLKMHEATHQQQIRVDCDQCDKTFVNMQAMKYHVMSKHSEQGVYQCSECNKVYKTAFLLKAHQRRHTTDGNRFMCDLCGRFFMYKSALEMHKAIHKDEKSYECNICHKTFKTYPTLYSHRSVHKEDSPFQCGQCGKAFKTKERCKAHEKRHSGLKPFECKLCNHCFPDNGGLSKHMKTVHCSTKKFVCEICGKATSRADNLRVHMKVHLKDNVKQNTPVLKPVKAGMPTVVPLTIEGQGSLLKRDRMKSKSDHLHDNSMDSVHSSTENSQADQNHFVDSVIFSQNIPNLVTIDSSQLSNTKDQALPLNLQNLPNATSTGYQLTHIDGINHNDNQAPGNALHDMTHTVESQVISSSQTVTQTAVVLPANAGNMPGLQPSPYMYTTWPYMYTSTGIQTQQGGTNNYFQ